jgi:hypothetical protein
MLKNIFIMILLIIQFGCTKQYITMSKAVTEDIKPASLIEENANVDYIKIKINYADDIINTAHLRRYTNTEWNTNYDGTLIKTWTGKNIKEIIDARIRGSEITPNVKYKYSIFYKKDNCTELTCETHTDSIQIKTLTHKQGMQKLLSNLIAYSKNKSTTMEHIIGGEDLDLILNNIALDTTINDNIINKIDGVLVRGTDFKDTNCNNQSENIGIEKAKTKHKRILTINYCYEGSDIIKVSQEASPNVLADIDENTTDTVEDILKLSNTTVTNAIFLERTLIDKTSIETILNKKYQIAILSPLNNVSENIFLTENKYIDLTEEIKNNKLIYAYINIGKMNRKSTKFYDGDNFESNKYDWNNNKPWNWVTKETNITSYWYPEWESILKEIIDKVHKQGYSGIIFYGIHEYKQFKYD